MQKYKKNIYIVCDIFDFFQKKSKSRKNPCVILMFESGYFSAIRFPASKAFCMSSSQCSSRYFRLASSENPASS